MAIPKEILGFFLILALCSQAVLSQNEDIDADADYQRQPRGNNEVEFTKAQDESFDAIVASSAVRPRSRPNRNQVRALYLEQKEDLINSAPRSQRSQMREDAGVMTYTPMRDYFTPSGWAAIQNNRTCCPSEWNYGCDSQRVPLPCFRRRYENNGRPQWCCPFWPDLTIKKCTCRRCAILKPKCAKEGRCQRRYRQKRFYAICYRNNAWSQIRYVNMYLPTSCYCLPLR